MKHHPFGGYLLKLKKHNVWVTGSKGFQKGLIITDFGELHELSSKMLKSKGYAASFHDIENYLPFLPDS
jgi:hypothetical protein